MAGQPVRAAQSCGRRFMFSVARELLFPICFFFCFVSSPDWIGLRNKIDEA